MIGIYGGTFNPVHYGHLRTAIEVLEDFQLSELRLLLSAQPPHRQRPSVTAQQRLQMLQLAVTGTPSMLIDTRELERSGPSYMVDSLAAMRKEAMYRHRPILLFIGADAFASLTSWHQWQQLFDYAHIVVMSRPQHEIGVLPEFFKQRLAQSKQTLSAVNHGYLYFHNVTRLSISSSMIRKKIAAKQNLHFLLPDEVIKYIHEHKLYQS